MNINWIRLTDADRSTVYEALNCCMQDTYEIDTRMMLSGTIYRDGEPVFENTALNDIVISRCGTLRVIDFDVYVNGEYLNYQTCRHIQETFLYSPKHIYTHLQILHLFLLDNEMLIHFLHLI